ncbi:MAG: site-2 protease family protein [Myxococcales bacterium]|nr:site-2 protease family protein [Myxococcales bacterium]
MRTKPRPPADPAIRRDDAPPAFAWSWRLGRVLGVALYVHATFVLLLAWLVIVAVEAGAGATAVAIDAAFLLALFATVVVHELGHATMARRFGIRTHAITLLPIGGVASLERMPERPRDELAIAIAGPLTSLGLAGLLFAIAGAVPAGAAHALLARLAWVNLLLAGFNLLPAFPMDGGRVLRAALALRLGVARATTIAATVGKLLAVVGGAIGLVLDPVLLLIAVFVWFGADQEAHVVAARRAIGEAPVALAMMTDLAVLAPDAPLSRAAELLLGGSQHEFPVVDAAGHPRGLVTRDDIVRGLATDGPEGAVADFMREHVPAVEAGDRLATALERLQTTRDGCSFVLDHGALVGLLTVENVAEYVAVREAMDHAQHHGHDVGAAA